jgi:hypothetical protein
VLAREIRLVHFAPVGTGVDTLVEGWARFGQRIDMLIGGDDVSKELREYVRALRDAADGATLINVVIPETIRHPGARHIVHALRVQRIKSRLAMEDDIVVTNIAHHPAFAELEPIEPPEDPRRAMEGWRHVAVVLVSAMNNATERSLRYARSLRADELHCLHVEVDKHETEGIRAEWAERKTDLELEVLPSPYRQIAKPVYAWVRGILDEQPRTFITIVIPELVVRRRWHRLLHNQTALVLKGTFLFEPSVVVSAVPYRL